jgi:flagellar operon protein
MVHAVDPFALQAARAAPAAPRPSPQAPVARGGPAFSEVLRREVATPADKGVRFSAHAQQRLAERNIRLTPDEQQRIGRAVDQAAEKGARESLVLMDRLALVVGVPDRTVITVMPSGSGRDAVFTQIDSAVVVGT